MIGEREPPKANHTLGLLPNLRYATYKRLIPYPYPLRLKEMPAPVP